MFFQEQYRIGMVINWRNALGGDFRAVERKCLRLQQFMIGDPSARVMMLDTFNENLIQAFSVRHLALKPHFASCIKFGKVVPDYGYWLHYKNALVGSLPRATPWLKAVQTARQGRFGTRQGSEKWNSHSPNLIPAGRDAL